MLEQVLWEVMEFSSLEILEIQPVFEPPDLFLLIFAVKCSICPSHVPYNLNCTKFLWPCNHYKEIEHSKTGPVCLTDVSSRERWRSARNVLLWFGFFCLNWRLGNQQLSMYLFHCGRKKIYYAYKQFLLLPENTEKLSVEVRDGYYFLGGDWLFHFFFCY